MNTEQLKKAWPALALGGLALIALLAFLLTRESTPAAPSATPAAAGDEDSAQRGSGTISPPAPPPLHACKALLPETLREALGAPLTTEQGKLPSLLRCGLGEGRDHYVRVECGERSLNAKHRRSLVATLKKQGFQPAKGPGRATFVRDGRQAYVIDDDTPCILQVSLPQGRDPVAVAQQLDARLVDSSAN